jgi:Glycosyltransferase family 87
MSQFPAPRTKRTLRLLTVICWAVCIVRIFVPAGLIVKDRVQAAQAGRIPDTEFVYFYSMGRVFNQYPSNQVYDYNIQKRVCSEVRTAKDGEYGPNPFHPVIGVLFRPFVRMGFGAAYLLWVSVSLCLFIGGLALSCRRFLPEKSVYRSLILCSALCSMPFIWTLLGGQVSMIGFFALALALYLDYDDRPILSGAALSACLYKPTLLVLFLPMLLVTRRYKTLLGFVAGGTVLCVLATAAEGIQVWPGYLRLLLSFARGVAGNHTTSAVGTIWYYGDLVSFFTLIPGGRSWLGLVVLSVCAVYAAWVLLRAWSKSVGTAKPAQALVWAATLTWTLVLNTYMPIYDSAFLILGVIASAGVLKYLPDQRWYRWLMLLWVLILACSWVTVSVARSTGFQMVTVLFVALGILQLVALRSVQRATSSTESGVEIRQLVSEVTDGVLTTNF